ncbi:hypothetical protein JOF56_003355 [Kibdelosporangium banguiense]|uniref:Glucosyl transferase GtrII n=1 Tax=Kibdelosporangium banguiense TaxID=1365924 RepID=A0ABS4TFY8_9PSEU|nr:glucosyltransferase domain-containing protein [Kibdelosporangium banguiense]MBP2322970.1 hypothetical protein [Kibdelosporangium banguiense]
MTVPPTHQRPLAPVAPDRPANGAAPTAFAALMRGNAERIREKRQSLRAGLRSDHFRFLLVLGVIAYVATFVVYNYFFTHVGFTNHTFPHTWVLGYPSFKTEYEGRWFADILIQLTGGSGVPTFLIALAAAVQIVNAFVFAAIWRVRNRATLVVLVLLFCFHPAILDYYSFSVDHVSFVIGDLLAILGTLALDRLRNRWYRIPLAILAFALALATYQPKIALIALLLIAWCLRPGDDNEVEAAAPAMVRRVAVAVASLSASVVVYYLSVLLTAARSGGERRHINSVSRMIETFADSYRETIANFTTRVDYLPSLLSFLPALLFVAAVAVLLVRARRRGLAPVILSVLLIACVPPALQLSYIINDETWASVGRILSVHLYLVGFAVIVVMAANTLGRIAVGVGSTVLLYFFVTVASQEANSAALREVYDTAKVQRIVTRIEQVVPDGLASPRPVVVIGELPLQSEQPFKRLPNLLYGAHVNSEPFVAYRQTLILNFFLGRPVIVAPTEAQIASATKAAGTHRAWPASDAVFVTDDGVLTVLLQPYRDGVPVTWKR